jgi:hypothetical protein
MDVTIIGNDLVAVLAPFLPYLVRLGEGTAEEAGKRFGAEAWAQAQTLWNRLRGRLEAQPAALVAAREVAVAPGDELARGALRDQVQGLLVADEALAAELKRLLDEWPGSVTAAIGDRSVAIGGDVRGSIINTGSQERPPGGA